MVLIFAALVVGATAVATARFRAMFAVERDTLLRRGRAAVAIGNAPEVAASLPPPVRRYLEVTRVTGTPRLRTATLRQSGALRTAADKPWKPFVSEQIYSMEPPGFLWLAKARMAPLVHLMARDKFVDGKGHMLIKLLGVVTVADERGPEMDQGAGLRFWGEVVAFPEMVRSPYLRWEPIDERSARLRVDQGGLQLTAVVEFDAQGYPVSTHAERFRDVDGHRVLTPWSGYSRDWKMIDGRMFPSRWESVWHLPAGDLAAVTMEIHAVTTE